MLGICMRYPNWATLWVKSLVVEGREGSRILLSNLRSMEVVNQSEGRWFELLSLPSSFQTTSKVASTAASRASRSEGKSGCWGQRQKRSKKKKKLSSVHLVPEHQVSSYCTDISHPSTAHQLHVVGKLLAIPTIRHKTHLN